VYGILLVRPNLCQFHRINIFLLLGQEIYYTSHQFFLSERSVYLVVFNLVNEPSKKLLDHWYICLPVFLVVVHKDA